MFAILNLASHPPDTELNDVVSRVERWIGKLVNRCLLHVMKINGLAITVSYTLCHKWHTSIWRFFLSCQNMFMLGVLTET